MSGNDDCGPVVSFRKVGAKKKQQQIRKREAPKEESASASGNDSDAADPGSSTMAKRLAKKRSKMTQSTKKRDQINRDSPSASNSDQEDEHKQNKNIEFDVKYSSEGLDKAGPSDMGATARTEHDTEYDRDSQAQFEKIQRLLHDKANKEKDGVVKEEEKLYKGQAMYNATLQKDTAKGNAKSGLNRLGPIRATQYMRASVRWDYAPDICKDYKETGFCTFGDSCKFMHDRGDYKHGWELERDWEQGKLKESKEDEFLISSDEDNNDEEDDIPFACFICRQEFNSPVTTKCGHHFCEKCAISKCRIRCAVCNQKTEGRFNVAKTLMKKLKERKDRQENKTVEESDVEDEDADLPPETLMENAEEPKGSDQDEEENEDNSEDADDQEMSDD